MTGSVLVNGSVCRGGCKQSEAACANRYPCCAECTHTFGEVITKTPAQRAHVVTDEGATVRRAVCKDCRQEFTQTGPGRDRLRCYACQPVVSQMQQAALRIGNELVTHADAARRYDLGRALELADKRGLMWWVTPSGNAHCYGVAGRISICGKAHEAAKTSPVPEEGWAWLCGLCVRAVNARVA